MRIEFITVEDTKPTPRDRNPVEVEKIEQYQGEELMRSTFWSEIPEYLKNKIIAFYTEHSARVLTIPTLTTDPLFTIKVYKKEYTYTVEEKVLELDVNDLAAMENAQELIMLSTSL